MKTNSLDCNPTVTVCILVTVSQLTACFMEPTSGIEPLAYALRERRSTN